MSKFLKICHSVKAEKIPDLTTAVTKYIPKIQAFVRFLSAKNVVPAKRSLYCLIFFPFSFFYFSKSNRDFRSDRIDKAFKAPILRGFIYSFCQFYQNTDLTRAVTKKAMK